MRHGLRTAKLGRPTAHRVLMLRNLVSSLLHHEQVTTTLPKAKAAQKLADKVIQWGKLGGKSNWDRANAFLLNPKDTLRPLFTTLAQRYASRPGGYTRIQRAGYRVGDNAPIAVLELVDSASDLRFERAARTVGREMALRAREGPTPAGQDGWHALRRRVEAKGPDHIGAMLGQARELEPLTRDNVVKALRYRAAPVPVDPATSVASASEVLPAAAAGEADAAGGAPPAAATTPVVHPASLFLDRAYHHYLASLAEFSLATQRAPDPLRTIKQLTQRLGSLELRGAPKPVVTVPSVGRTPKAGERTDGWEAHVESGEEVSRRGGPIARAKGNKGRESRAWGAGAGAAKGKADKVAQALEADEAAQAEQRA
ncbi:RNA recognition motif-type RNA-binding protein [Rhodotorula diobovata]|uniref:RNA recognition motif-type RNA-binding protein n=1 Tax=Rhodotorula diobovata TaxID=5288 RepID=A0A5C5FU36_9BASI|nr:RNA recognition motif-type RNA-binding protein [Rhodotorula diobovata]